MSYALSMRTMSWNRTEWSDHALRIGLMAVVAVVALLAIVVLTAEDAEAWSGVTKYSDDLDFMAGYAYYYYEWHNTYGSSRQWYKSSTDPVLYYYYYSGSSSYSYQYYRSWLSIPISDFDTRTHVEAAYLYLYFRDDNNWNDAVYIRWLRFDPMVSSAQEIYDGVANSAVSYHMGSLTVTTVPGTYYIQLNSQALTYLRTAIASGDEYIHFGFYGTSSSDEYLIFDADRSYCYFIYDDSGPSTPRLNALSTYTSGNRVQLTWSATSDLPSGGSVGLHSQAYQIGIFDYPSHEPVQLTPWFDGSAGNRYIYNLDDGKLYYFKLRARDASGFESAWSYEAWTTMDASPPSIPVIEQEPPYTSGTSNVVDWADSTDAGVGLAFYQIQRSTTPNFSGGNTYTTVSSTYTFNNLASGTTYYYRVSAVDAFGYTSEWSVPQMSAQDNDPPTVPVMLAEPLYTPGTSNVFNWHPASDAGVGVWRYHVQVATDSAFTGASMVISVYTTETSAEATLLRDGRTYYCRVRAQDLFGALSGWSESEMSIQDDAGPGLVGLEALPAYSPDGPVRLEWNGAIDEGVGTAWYYVQWSMTPDFSPVVDERDHIVGSMLLVLDLADNTTWYFRVCGVDMFSNQGEYEMVNTTIDGDPPEAPVVDEEPMYTMGTENTISWQPSADELSGVDHYAVEVFATSAGTGLVFMDVTDVTHMTVPNLADGGKYYYRVTAVDGAGNANSSALVSSTQDASAPTPPHMMPMPTFTAGTTVNVEWRPSVDTGSGGVEYQLVWSTTEDFALTAGQTGWNTATSYEVTGLTDGMAYYFRAWSRDALSQVSQWGDMAGTIMDASPPPAPAFGDVPEFVPGPYVPLTWEPVLDGSGQRVEYQVLAYDTDEAGATPIATSPWLPDPRFEFMGLPEDSAVYFKVVARDILGWTSAASEAAVCTIDTEGPAGAAIHTLPGNSQGTTLTVTWTPATDDGVGGVTHRLMVYEDEAMLVPVHAPEWTSVSEATVRGLVDGMKYWLVVECRDAFGNLGAPSETAFTTMDASGPIVTVDAPGVFGPLDSSVSGTFFDAGSGVATVEASGDGGTNWVDINTDGDTWFADFSDLPAEATEVMVRAIDQVGNTGAMAYATIDRDKPVVAITIPTDGEEVSGAVAIVGSISDAHLASYIVEVQRAGESTWTTVQPSQATSGVAGTLATWVTSGMVGGDYTLRVTASDGLGNSDSATVTVTLMGAHLSIGPGDITFSDSHPLPGDTVTVLVTVRNDGDSPAEGVTVSLYDGGKLVGSQDGVTVPAHGTAVVPVKVKAEDSHDFTARATSDLYDSGDMDTGQPLQAIEEEAVLENAGGLLGLIALILALLALLLILMGRRGGGAEVPEPEPAEDVIVDPFMEQDAMESEPEPLPAPMPIEMEIEEMPDERPRTGGFR